MAGIFICAFSYVAALMGAGFASGQEVVTFFVVFGKWGILGIAVSAVLIGLFGGMITEYALRKNLDYAEIVPQLMPIGCAKAVGVLAFLYSVCVTAVMLACFGELGTMLFGLPRICGALALAVVCGFLLIKGNNTALKLNGILGAMLFMLCASVSLYLLGYREHQTFGDMNAVRAGASGTIYAGYNLINVGAALAFSRVFLKKKGDGMLSGMISGLMIFILLMLMWGIISIYYGKINLGEIPMLTLTLRESKGLAWIYAAVIAAAVLTTALSSGMCAVEYINGRAGRIKAVIAVMGAGLALSGAGFSQLIDTLYRYCGYLGIIAAFFVMIRTGKMLKSREK